MTVRAFQTRSRCTKGQADAFGPAGTRRLPAAARAQEGRDPAGLRGVHVDIPSSAG